MCGMKNLSVSITILFLLLLNTGAVGQGNEVSKGVTAAIKGMDASKLATWFGSTLDLEVPGVSGTYSKVQAEEIMRDFFKKTPAKSFSVNHEGSSNDGSQFIIGTYSTATKNMRVYVLMKKEPASLMIRQLHFDEE